MKHHREITAMLFGLALAFIAMSVSAGEVPAAKQSGNPSVVNINTASAQQLAYLPGVGEKLAERIAEYRTTHGPFRRVADLRFVKGFGGDGKRLGKVSPYAMVSGPTTAERKIKGGAL